VQRLRRPHKDASRAEKIEFLRTMANALEVEGIVPGAEFIIEAAPDRAAPGGSRRTDPSTSQKAAFDAAPRTGTQRAVALRAIASAGGQGMTYWDVERATGITGVWKRLSELKQGGWIKVIDTRAIPATGSDGEVYAVTDKGRDYTQGRPVESSPAFDGRNDMAISLFGTTPVSANAITEG
jgi:hypothetical protein